MSTDDESRRPASGDGQTPGQPGQPDAPSAEPFQLPTDPPEPAPYASEPGADPTADKPSVDKPSADEPDVPDGPGESSESASRRAGRIRRQDETTVPREPTLAERRARELAARREEEAEEERLAEEARKKKLRKRVLIGGGVTVGVVALIAIGYAISQPDDEVEARCVDPDTNLVVDDSNCVQPAAGSTASGSYYGGGFVPYPIFIGGGGRQYHYTYGGSGNVGQVATGGTTVAPKDATVKTSSGRTIQRGGFGVSKSGTTGSSGGSSGKSGGS